LGGKNKEGHSGGEKEENAQSEELALCEKKKKKRVTMTKIAEAALNGSLSLQEKEKKGEEKGGKKALYRRLETQKRGHIAATSR